MNDQLDCVGLASEGFLWLLAPAVGDTNLWSSVAHFSLKTFEFCVDKVVVFNMRESENMQTRTPL